MTFKSIREYTRMIESSSYLKIIFIEIKDKHLQNFIIQLLQKEEKIRPQLNEIKIYLNDFKFAFPKKIIFPDLEKDFKDEILFLRPTIIQRDGFLFPSNQEKNPKNRARNMNKYLQPKTKKSAHLTLLQSLGKKEASEEEATSLMSKTFRITSLRFLLPHKKSINSQITNELKKQRFIEDKPTKNIYDINNSKQFKKDNKLISVIPKFLLKVKNQSKNIKPCMSYKLFKNIAANNKKEDVKLQTMSKFKPRLINIVNLSKEI